MLPMTKNNQYNFTVYAPQHLTYTFIFGFEIARQTDEKFN